MIHSLYPWSKLTRSGVIPPMRVCRLPILTQGMEIQVGEVIAPETFASPLRMRQFYERRRIEPVTPPPNTLQAARDNDTGSSTAAEARKELDRFSLSVPPPLTPVDCVDVSQTVPQAQAQSIADLLGGVDVPVVEDDFPDDTPIKGNSKSKSGGYAPRRGVRTS